MASALRLPPVEGIQVPGMRCTGCGASVVKPLAMGVEEFAQEQHRQGWRLSSSCGAHCPTCAPLFAAPGLDPDDYEEAPGADVDLNSVVRWAGKVYRVVGIAVPEMAPYYALEHGPTVGHRTVTPMRRKEGT